MQKVLILLLTAALLLTGQPFPQEPGAPELSAQCAVLMEPEGQILYEKNAHTPALIASTTKLMTALVALEHAELDGTVEVPAVCCAVEGSSMYLTAGETYTVEELLTGLLLASGNDAAEALALYCAGSEERFVAWMNEKAEALGMADSHFANPHGLDADGHYGSAADLGLLMAACMEQPALREILSLGQACIHEQYYVNHNKLLWRCPGCLGGKTGYTQAAGRCLVSVCERDGTRLYCVTLSAPDDWNDHIALYDWGFSRYVTADVTARLCYVLPLFGAVEDRVRVQADPLPLFLPKSAELQLRTELPPFVLGPVRAGEVCGRVRIFWNGEELGGAALRFTEDAGETGRDT